VPIASGACDASGEGLGGVWWEPTLGKHLAWRWPLPSAVRSRLVSSSNPSGDLTINNLELAAVYLHLDILASAIGPRRGTVHIVSDNTTAVAWIARGSVSRHSVAAYLLRALALQQRQHHLLARVDHISGEHNSLADLCSCQPLLSDSSLCSALSALSPQSWEISQVPSSTLSIMTSALQRQRSELVWSPPDPGPMRDSSRSGLTSATLTMSTPSSATSPTQSHSYKSLPSGSATVDSPRISALSGPGRLRKLSGLWARRWPAWGPRTLA